MLSSIYISRRVKVKKWGLSGSKARRGFLISKANVPVLPILIMGSEKAWPKGEGIKLGARIDVVIGGPISPKEPWIDDGSTNYSKISETVMNRIKELQNKRKKVKI